MLKIENCFFTCVVFCLLFVLFRAVYFGRRGGGAKVQFIRVSCDLRRSDAAPVNALTLAVHT